MDEGNNKVNEVEVQNNVNETKKRFDFKNINFKKIDYKKYGLYGGIILAVIIVITILASIFSGGPKKTVKEFVSGINSKNAKKIVKSIDIAGTEIWSYDPSNFTKGNYKDFIDDYKKIDKEQISDLEDEMIDKMDDSLDKIKNEYKSFKIKIEKIKSVKEIGKDLYAVKTKITLKANPKDKSKDKIDNTETITFVVYKNKLILSGGVESLFQ